MPKRKNAQTNETSERNPVVDYMVKKYLEEGQDFDMNESLKEIVSAFLKDILNTEMDTHLGHKKYERTKESETGDERKNYRNGSFPKNVKSQFGEMNIEIPRDRIGTFEPQIIPKGERNISGIDDKIIRLYANGMTERDIANNLEDLYGYRYSATTISQITDKIIPLIREWQNRPLHRIYAYIFIDAAYFNVRNPGGTPKKACYTAIGVTMQGKREVLGFWIGNNESASYWCSIFQELKARGLEDVLLFCVDGLTGIIDAIHAVYPEAFVQRCLVHQMRNCFKLISYKDGKEITKEMKKIYQAPTLSAAEDALDALE